MSERRLDPVTLEWTRFAPPGDDECELCVADASAAGGAIVVVPAAERAAAAAAAPTPLYAAAPPDGAVECVVYSDRHGETLADGDRDLCVRLIEVWADRYRELGGRDDVAYVFISEEAGGGVHPHARVHPYATIPPRARRELEVAAGHLREHGTCVFCDVVAREAAERSRLVAENGSFLAFVPFAARFPHEVHVAAHRHATSLLDLTDAERDALAEVLHEVVSRYGRLSGGDLAYALAVHQSPTDDGEWLAVSHFHLELFPRPAAPSAAGVAAGAYVNTMLPEQAARELAAAG